MKLSYATSVLYFLLALLAGCHSPMPVYQIEERNLDTLYVRAPRSDDPATFQEQNIPVYRATPERTTDIIHTELDLAFDWSREEVIGRADLTLTPWFYDLDTVCLDAKKFHIKDVIVNDLPTKDWVYDSAHLYIPLPTTRHRGDIFRVSLRYTARPAATGGSTSIQSNQGLFFINASGRQWGVPQQIWTQGETQWNSRWFPTVDHPNERFTQDIRLTVDTSFTTLSNGILLEAKPNGDGTRTDHWSLKLPHAPYLAMIAVGKFAAVSDQWKNIPLTFYVEPQYREDAPYIFARTPEMLTFFSERFDFPFPWPSYNQIVVREFVSGAMENTTAVVFGDFVQKRRRALIDNPNDNIVAHELVHHWFGNLVTCESWANLTLNEGFANYGEYLWLEHWYGREEADFHLYLERDGYFRATDLHPLIHFQYDDAEHMFDSHSYNKGGAVLHMLRYELGDDAFFSGLSSFLRKHAFQSVEIHDLRLAMEKVSGRDLNWFFQQWYLYAGHPVLDIAYDYDTTARELIVHIEQKQNPDVAYPVFRLPVAFDLYLDGKTTRVQRMLRQRKKTFRIPVPQRPALVIFDPEGILLAEVNEQKDKVEYARQLQLAPFIQSRWHAWQKLKSDHPSLSDELWSIALRDPFRAIRAQAAGIASPLTKEATLMRLSVEDPDSRVRAQSITNLGKQANPDTYSLIEYVLEQDSSYMVRAAALRALFRMDADRALAYAKKWEQSAASPILTTIAALYAQQEDCSKLTFFTQEQDAVSREDIFDYLHAYQQLAYACGTDSIRSIGNRLAYLASDFRQSVFHRYAATSALNELTMALQYDTNLATDEKEKDRLEKLTDYLRQRLSDATSTETDAQLRRLYRQLPSIRPEPK